MLISRKSLTLIGFLDNILGFSMFSDIMRRDRVAPCSGKLGRPCYDDITIIQHVGFLIIFFSQWTNCGKVGESKSTCMLIVDHLLAGKQEIHGDSLPRPA